LANYETRLASIDNQLAPMNGRISAIEGKLTVMIWAIGINAAATITISGVLLHHS
jgi:hypothetical protein